MIESTRWLVPALALFLAACAGEGGENTQSSRPGESRPAASGGLKFTAPAGWVVESPSSSMRQAQYRLPRAEGDPEDAEMVVFYFQGQGGSVQANIDRWVGQFAKPDGSPATDVARTSRKEVRGMPLTVVDVSGTYSGAPMMAQATPKAGFRMLAAVAETPSGPWFFKLTGPEKTLARWETSFHSFLESIN